MVAHAGYHNLAVMGFVTHIGHAGVLAFFVHTSLVLMYSLERMTRSVERVTLRFYVRRFFRIYPLSVFCITLALIFHIPNMTWQTPDVITTGMVFSNLLLVQDVFARTSILSPLWSLPYEVQMYLVLPALYFLALRKHSPILLGGLYVFFCGFGILVFIMTHGHLNMAEYIPCFICGVLCYSLRDRIPARIPAFFWPPFVLALISGYCLVRETHDKAPYMVGWIFCLLLGLAINAFHDSTFKPINFVAEKVALYSYGIYLIHLPILYLVFIVLGIKSHVFGTLLFLAGTMAASIIAYHFIESPLIEVGRKLSSRKSGTPVSLTASETQEVS
jgi:peptidoglycan/LPS O-acetylase OafA/YrhL